MKRKLNLLICLAVLATFVYQMKAENFLHIVRIDRSTIELQLENSDTVRGIQCSIHSSIGIILKDLVKHGRTAENHWTVASYQPNDSTINVVILSTAGKSFDIGSGSLLRFSYVEKEKNSKNMVTLENVKIVDPRADKLAVTVNPLIWEQSNLLAEESEKGFTLGQNYPNPFNPATSIIYKLDKAAQVRLSIYDIAGREVSRLVDQYQYVGQYSVNWSANNSGQSLASGMYIARLTVDNESVSRKMILAK